MPVLRHIVNVATALLAAAAISTGSCADSTQPAAAETVTVDLGRRPLSVRERVRVAVPPLRQSRRLERVRSTCHCMAARLFAAGKGVSPGEVVEAGTRLELALTYESLGKAGRLEHRVAAIFRAVDAESTTTERRVLHVRTVHERQLSIGDGLPIRKTLVLPAACVFAEIALRSPLESSKIECEGGDWLTKFDYHWDAASGRGSVVFRLGDLDTVGDYEGLVLLPFSKTCQERVRVELRARAFQTLRPERIVTRLSTGSTQTIPVRLDGLRLAFTPASVTWEPPEHGAADKAPAAFSMALEADATPQAAGIGTTAIALKINAGTVPGLFAGRALIRPYPGAKHRLPLVYSIRVADVTVRAADVSEGKR